MNLLDSIGNSNFVILNVLITPSDRRIERTSLLDLTPVPHVCFCLKAMSYFIRHKAGISNQAVPQRLSYISTYSRLRCICFVNVTKHSPNMYVNIAQVLQGNLSHFLYYFFKILSRLQLNSTKSHSYTSFFGTHQLFAILVRLETPGIRRLFDARRTLCHCAL